MKVLITGATANQTNPVMHQRCINYAGLMREAFESVGAQVVWQRPDVSVQSYAEYDKVLVGLSSPLSLASNHMYGALTCVASLWGDPRLAFYIDAADPNNVTRGLESVVENPDSLFKDFFVKRKGYEDADRELIIELCNRLWDNEWPTTLVPELPWVYDHQIAEALPLLANDSVRMVNLDSLIFKRFSTHSDREYPYSNNMWNVEKRHDKKWLKSLSLALPVVALDSNHRADVMEPNLAKLQTATGFLHSPYRLDRTWWTPYIAMALSQRTAVFTNWRYSKKLGDEWAVLPGTFETFSSSEQNAVALAQYEAYVASIPTAHGAAKTLTTELGL